MNRVILKGNLTRDPEIRRTQDGTAVCEIGLAVNEKFKNKAGEVKDRVLFIDVNFWGKRAECIEQYFEKGSPVIVEGKLQLDQWENDKGEKRSKITVRGENFDFCERSKNKPAPDDGDIPAPVSDDDIPF
ncbi:MAG: single-stranded DNA-binding protein [Kiritimatiellales bacterium]